jgi:hypothetical protein
MMPPEGNGLSFMSEGTVAAKVYLTVMSRSRRLMPDGGELSDDVSSTMDVLPRLLGMRRGGLEAGSSKTLVNAGLDSR